MLVGKEHAMGSQGSRSPDRQGHQKLYTLNPSGKPMKACGLGLRVWGWGGSNLLCCKFANMPRSVPKVYGT